MNDEGIVGCNGNKREWIVENCCYPSSSDSYQRRTKEAQLELLHKVSQEIVLNLCNEQ